MDKHRLPRVRHLDSLFRWVLLLTLFAFAVEFETNAPEYNGSVLVLLNFSSSDPCWFDLRPKTPACGDNSPRFDLLPVQRSQSDPKTTLGLLSSTPTASTPSNTGAPVQAHGPPDSPPGQLNSGAKAGIAIAILGASFVVLGMASCFFFRRRKRLQEDIVAGHIINYDKRGRKSHEKRPLAGGSAHSNGSTEPLPVQPVYDGFPGSSGYNDDRSLNSGSYLQSPQSPSSSSAQGYFPAVRNRSTERHFLSEREELDAARQHSASIVSGGVVSYGPNPLTPTVTPRPSTRFHEHPSTGSAGSGVIHEQYYAPSSLSISPQLHAQYQPNSAPPPLVVSYGPNKITPTPVIATAAIAPDQSIMTGPPDLPEFPLTGIPSPPFPSHEPQSPSTMDTATHDLARYGLTDESASALAPLPPYASAADFYAMEKGAIRKLQEPAAAAELPPTRDGYYHFGDHGTEYELQGAAPQNEQQHPHQVYRNQADGRGRRREVDEQKVLLSDAELAHMRAQKARIRAAQQAAQQAQQGGESYEMQPAGASASRSESREEDQS